MVEIQMPRKGRKNPFQSSNDKIHWCRRELNFNSCFLELCLLNGSKQQASVLNLLLWGVAGGTKENIHFNFRSFCIYHIYTSGLSAMRSWIWHYPIDTIYLNVPATSIYHWIKLIFFFGPCHWKPLSSSFHLECILLKFCQCVSWLVLL